MSADDLNVDAILAKLTMLQKVKLLTGLVSPSILVRDFV